MSPAAVGVRSPTASREISSSATESRSSTSSFDFSGVFPGFGGGEFRRSDSVAPGKARPRLVKVRKQVALRTKSGTGTGTNGSGFNPFGGGGGNDRSRVTREAENLGFVFAARENNSKPKFSVGKEEPLANEKCSQFTKSLSPEAEVFVFGAKDRNGSLMNSRSSRFSSETDAMKSSSSDSVFGPSGFSSGSEKSESSENVGRGVREVEASASKRSSKSGTGDTPFEFVKSSSDETKPFNEVKFSGESAENLSKFTVVNNLDPNLGLRLNSSYESSDGKASVSCKGSVFKLPDEMGKLNIDDTVRTGIPGTKLPHSFGYVFNSTRLGNANRGSNKVSDFATTHKGTTSCDRSSEGYSFSAEKVSGNASGSVKQNGVSCSEAFAFQAGLSETNKDDQNEKGRGVDYSYREPNLASSSCNYPTESVSSVEEKSRQNTSPTTPDRFGASSMDSGTPLCDPCSLRESLFPSLIKTPVVKNRSIREKRLKDSRRKLKKPLVKPCTDKDSASKESSLQEDTNTSECYSPMDFSPYQASAVADQCQKETPETPTQSKIDDEIPSVSLFGNGARVTPMDSSDVRKQEEKGTQFIFTSGLDDKTKSCMFSATSAGQGGVSARRHRYRRRSRIGVGNDTFVITPSTNVKPEPSTVRHNAVGKAEVHETCEIWRMRGNEAYKKGDMSRAEVLYTQGIVCVPSSERSGNSLEALLLCYSNRAAARMRLQRVREAIGDCTMAIALDPKFLKAQMRAANCHLLLGEIKHASVYFNKCMEVGSGVCLDRRIIVDASDGHRKAQKIAECTEQSAKLLEEKNYDAALRSLGIISEALSISSYSEKLLRLKAESLTMLRRHEEVVQLCEESVSFAEKNFSSDSANGNHFVRLWRWFLMARSYFLLGKFEAALTLLDKLKQVGSGENESARKDLESATSLATTIRLLSDTKNAGNEAFKSGRYSEAIEHYTAALSSNVGSRHFAAICFCNRAAAHQVLGQITDAIADCSLAIAIDGNYTKALSRRATLHEMIRDYGQAASDLQRLVSVLESQPCNKSKQSGSSGRSTASAKELRQAQTRLPVMEQEAKSGTSLDFYLILGSKSSDSSADIKKAYRKAALKHHPDKAGQFLARSDNGDEGRLWKEISEEVHKDADRLFKIIGEAYTVLSDSSKRSEYDLDEELRRSSKLNNGSTAQRRQSDCHYSSRSSSYRRSDFGSSPFGGSYKRNSKDNWKTYGDSYSKW